MNGTSCVTQFCEKCGLLTNPTFPTADTAVAPGAAHEFVSVDTYVRRRPLDWAHEDSNLGPRRYQRRALAN